MLAEHPTSPELTIANRVFDAIEQGELGTLRGCFAPDARAWHNTDDLEIDVDSVIEMIGHLCAVSTNRKYTDRRITSVGSQIFIQQTLTADLSSGCLLRMQAMVRIEVDSDGLVSRMEEYLDSRAVDLLAGEPRAS